MNEIWKCSGPAENAGEVEIPWNRLIDVPARTPASGPCSSPLAELASPPTMVPPPRSKPKIAVGTTVPVP